MWQTYYQPTTLTETLDLLHTHAGQARIVAGGTDVLVELQRGVRPTQTLIDITQLSALKYVRHQDGQIRLGALATHNDVIASTDCVAHALPLAQACWEVGAPQIRTRATVAGNLITASPANDTITALLALNAEVVLVNQHRTRTLPLSQFYAGFRRTVLEADELLQEIRIPALQPNQRGLFLKLGLRRAQAISVIDIAFVLGFDQASSAGQIVDARITLGCLAPTIVHAPSAEAYLLGKMLTPEVCAQAGKLACQDVKPIDDVRGSAQYRLATLENLVAHGLQRIADGEERTGWPQQPVLLESGVRSQESEVTIHHPPSTPFAGVIEITVNGAGYSLQNAHTKSLLDALREDVGLTGTKEGCAEGECGACTVWLDGQAVMSCLTPAAQAHGARVTTIEGLATIDSQKTSARSVEPSEVRSQQSEVSPDEGQLSTFNFQLSTPNEQQPAALHPLQQAFIDHAAVQCGYCIPGMIMAGAKLLEERPQPTLDQIQTALSGNICRCTGYRKIVDAVQAAASGRGDGSTKFVAAKVTR